MYITLIRRRDILYIKSKLQEPNNGEDEKADSDNNQNSRRSSQPLIQVHLAEHCKIHLKMILMIYDISSKVED